MEIKYIIQQVENIAPLSLQEGYDNSGLICGNKNWPCSGVLICLDALEAVLDEAIALKINLIIAHHPIVFAGLKKITGSNYVEKIMIKAIKNDIAIYAIHTNLDNVLQGVNGKIASMLQLNNTKILLPKPNTIKKLVTYVPLQSLQPLLQSLYAAGAGNIGNYSECSFTSEGIGTFKPNEIANPTIGTKNLQHHEKEAKIEVIFNDWQTNQVIEALLANHPYEEVAYQIFNINNTHQQIGSGVVGYLQNPLLEIDFLAYVKKTFNLSCIRHTKFIGKPVHKVAVCGGAGSFLIKNALQAKVDAFITSDVKYHEFFDAENNMLLADIGHFESEQFTINLIFDILKEKFPTFAIQKTKINTNSVQYYF